MKRWGPLLLGAAGFLAVERGIAQEVTQDRKSGLESKGQKVPIAEVLEADVTALSSRGRVKMEAKGPLFVSNVGDADIELKCVSDCPQAPSSAELDEACRSSGPTVPPTNQPLAASIKVGKNRRVVLPKGRWELATENVEVCKSGKPEYGALIGPLLCVTDKEARLALAPSAAWGTPDAEPVDLQHLDDHGCSDAPRKTARIQSGPNRIPLEGDGAWKILPGTSYRVEWFYNRPFVRPNAQAKNDEFPICLPEAAQARVTLPRPPPTRVRGTFVSATGEHAELQWDPASSLRLSRTVTLGPGCWRVAFLMDPEILPENAQSNRETEAWTFVPPAWSANDAVATSRTVCTELLPAPTKAMATGGAAAPSAAPSAAPPSGAAAPPPASKGTCTGRDIRVDVVALPTLTDAARRLSMREGGAVGGRAFGGAAIPDVVNDALQLLAEIAFDKAKARSMQLLSDRLQRFVCTNLALDDDELERVDVGFARTFRDLTRQTARSTVRLLPTTCEIVRSLRIQEIASSGEAVLHALFGDLALFGQAVVTTRLDKLGFGATEKAVLDLVLRQMLSEIVSLARGEKPDAAREAQLLLTNLAQALARASDEQGATAPKSVRCALLLGTASLSTCLASEGCDARLIADMVRNPDDYFEIGGCRLDEIQKAWPTLSTWVSRAIEVLQPPAGTDARTTFRRAVELLFEATAHLLEERRGELTAAAATSNPADLLAAVATAMKDKSGATGDSVQQWDVVVQRIEARVEQRRKLGTAQSDLDFVRSAELAAELGQAQLLLRAVQRSTPLDKRIDDVRRVASVDVAMLIVDDVRTISEGVLDSNPQPVIAASAQLMRHLFPLFSGTAASELGNDDGPPAGRGRAARNLAAAARVLAAVTSYAQTYAGPGDNADAKASEAKRAARKKAMESLIDTFTDRAGRGGDYVVSVGIAAGLQPVGVQSRSRDSADAGPYAGQLALPLGIAVQRLPDPDAPSVRVVGFHLQASVIDVGQYLVFDKKAVNKPTWNALLAPGGQIGFAFGTPADTFVVGADARWAPALFDTIQDGGRGAFRAGLFLGYYVPLFDVN